MAQFKFKAIGTSWIIDVYDATDQEKEAALLSAILKRIDEFDKAYSRFRPDSTVSQIAKEAGDHALPPDADLLFSTYHDLYKLTGGFFTPLIGGMLVDAGYDAAYSLKQKKALTPPPSWEEALEFHSTGSKDAADGMPLPFLSVRKPVQLDFGAAGKGYLIDLVGKVLEEQGVRGFLINAGGDIVHRDARKPAEGTAGDQGEVRIGLEHPENFEQVIGVCRLGNESICGSAGNRRRWGDFTHIMDPKTGASPRDIIAVWVVAPSALIADALTTCLFFVQPEALAKSYEFEYVIVYKDYSCMKSKGFRGEIFIR